MRRPTHARGKTPSSRSGIFSHPAVEECSGGWLCRWTRAAQGYPLLCVMLILNRYSPDNHHVDGTNGTMSAEPKTGGDDLDDGLELDPSLMASDDEGAELGEDEGAYLSDEEEAPEPVSRKRKAADSADSAEPVSEEQAKKDAKKRRREKDKARKAAKVGQCHQLGS